MGAVNIMVVQVGMFDSLESEVLGSRRSESEPHGRMQAACPQQSAVARVGIYSHFWLLLQEYTLLYMYMYMYMYINIQRIQYTDSMVPSFARIQRTSVARNHNGAAVARSSSKAGRILVKLVLKSARIMHG